MLVSFTFSLSFMLESPNRWGEMSLYVLANWFEGYGFSLLKRQYIAPIPHWEKYALMVAMGIISHAYFSPEDKSEGPPASRKLNTILNYIIGSQSFDSK